EGLMALRWIRIAMAESTQRLQGVVRGLVGYGSQLPASWAHATTENDNRRVPPGFFPDSARRFFVHMNSVAAECNIRGLQPTGISEPLRRPRSELRPWPIPQFPLTRSRCR